MRTIPFHLHTAIFLMVILPWLHTPSLARSQQYKPNELLVKFKTNIRGTDKAGLHFAASARQVSAIGNGQIHRITLPDDISVTQAVAIYANHPDVIFAEPNYRLRTQSLPDDPGFNQQWGLNNIGQMVQGYVGTTGADLDSNQAWDITSGSATVVVAVIDTGCDYNHPDLAANIWTNPGEIADNGIDDDGNGFIDDYYGWDFSDDDADPQDGTGHGTHVAGIIAAKGDNSLGISGVAWQAQIMPVRFINAFEVGYTDDAIRAIRYATAQGAKIINCSWGGYNYSAALRSAIADTDALFVCAAGNNATDVDVTGFYPAGFDADNIISVAASDMMDHLTYFSNFGKTQVDVTAPGIHIYSLLNGRQTIWQENFSDLDMDGWTVEGIDNTWGVADPPAATDAPSLATSPNQNYANDADTWVQAPILELGIGSTPNLAFRVIGQSEANTDLLLIEASSNGISWSEPPMMLGKAIQSNGISGTLPYWVPVKIDLNAWENISNLYLRLRFQSNATVAHDGYYLDDFALSMAAPENTYAYKDGTSMAAGFVSGLAALLLSKDNELTALEIKTIIENSVDVDLDLMDLLASGGRINAFNALTLLDDLSLSANSAAADRIALSWTAQAPLDSMVFIERRAEGQTNFETVAQVSADINYYEDDALIPESTYYYRVQADTIDGRSGYSNQTLATTLRQSNSSGGGSSGGGCFIDMIVACLGNNL